MGRRLQARRERLESRALARLTASYLAVFAAVIAVLSAVAYAAIASNYRSIVGPALGTPEGNAGLAAALRPALFAILSCDALLLLAVGAASFALARAALRPLALAREREERFSADVAHELRTPLGAIAATAEAARAGSAGEAQGALEAIARRALECGDLVSDLLTLARTDGASALECEPVDLAGLAARACRDLDAGPRVAVDASFESAIVEGDERRIGQLMRNLLDNARAHARSRIIVRVTGNSGQACFTVEDDGPGVEPHVIPHLFERFAKGAGSRGTGLGLAICRWVARAHGGDVGYGGGSRFIARFPLARVEKDEAGLA
jgi:signal transduction histidine kinase